MFNPRSEIWRGVFNSRDGARSQESASGHLNSRWLAKSLDRLRTAREGDLFIQERELPEWAYPIDAILALASQDKNPKTINIADVGGNLGQLAILCEGILPGYTLNYSVLELQEFLSKVPPEVLASQRCKFFTEMPEMGVDFLVMGSVFQYLESPFDFLAKIVSLGNPRFIGIFDALVGREIETFTSIQMYYESSMVCTFYALEDVNDIMYSLGYELLTVRPLITSRSKMYFPQESLPQKYRIPNPLNLIYRRLEPRG